MSSNSLAIDGRNIPVLRTLENFFIYVLLQILRS